MKARLLSIVLFFGMGFLFVSCDQFYFSTPQPIDAKNLNEFPNESRGSWTDNGDSIVIGRDNFISVEYNEKKVAKKEVEASSRYKLKGNKVYVVDDKKGLKAKRGFPYVLKRDTIFYKEAEVFELKLGSETFLRKGDGVYVLNSKHGANWWEIFIVDLNDPETIITRYLNADDMDKINNLKTIHVAENQYFLEATWSKNDINELLRKGVFSDTILILQRKKNLKR